MRVKSLGLIAASLLAFAPVLAFAGDKGSADINLKEKFGVKGNKEAVIFPHAKHQANPKLTCDKCHETAQGGKLKVTIEKKEGMKNDFHDKMCFPCHTEMNVPKGKVCTTCHKK
ncbi:MAG: cytochrome c3 family protein [Dissulfurimicrobium sp.]|uniref:cytochrome c3 family protein n=1 Tax=Dissulfurimicrobium hydrothermale TaxID=1750598 RepID=UPI003C79658B